MTCVFVVRVMSECRTVVRSLSRSSRRNSVYEYLPFSIGAPIPLYMYIGSYRHVHILASTCRRLLQIKRFTVTRMRSTTCNMFYMYMVKLPVRSCVSHIQLYTYSYIDHVTLAAGSLVSNAHSPRRAAACSKYSWSASSVPSVSPCTVPAPESTLNMLSPRNGIL